MQPLGKNPSRACILHAVGYLALSGGLAAWTLVLTLRACGGELIPPLDDTYIYLQYARAAAGGEPLAYQPGAEATRGATSLLYPLLLAPAARILSPAHLMAAAWLLGVLAMAGTALAADRWAARRLGPGAAGAAGLLVLLSGHFLWGGVSGMDIAPYALGVTASLALVPWYLEAGDRETGIRRLGLLGLALLFLSLSRPEGILLAGLIAAGVPLAGRAPNSRRGRAVLLLAPILAATGMLGVNLLALGEFGTNSVKAKALWTEPNDAVRHTMILRLPRVALDLVTVLLSDFRSRVFGFGTERLLPGLLSLGALAGLVAAIRRGAAERILVMTLLGALAASLVPAGPHSHHYRYVIPYLPAVTLLVLLGWWWIGSRRPWIRWTAIGLIGILLLPGLWNYGRLVARNAANIHDQQVAMGRWIAGHLPPDARVGINDAGAIPYYAERPVIDLIGLVTNGPATATRAGPGSLFEWLETLPADARPTHFAVFPNWYEYLRRTSLFGAKLAQLTLADNTISGGSVKALYEADWSSVGRADDLWIRRELVDLWGFTIVDRLDVGDLEQQAAHDYRAFDTWHDTLREFPVEGIPRFLLIEGGRQPSRGERFTLACRPGEPAVLVLRTEAFRDFELDVTVDGEPVGRWTIPRAPLVWTEPMFEISPDRIRGDRVTITLTQTPSELPYPSFHYWLLQ